MRVLVHISLVLIAEEPPANCYQNLTRSGKFPRFDKVQSDIDLAEKCKYTPFLHLGGTIC